MEADDFAVFYRSNYEQIRRYVERRLDGDHAEEVTAECFVIAWKKFGSNELPGKAWLYQTARNLVGTAYQKRDAERRLFERAAELVDETTSADVILDVARALASLKPREREAIELTYWEGLSAAEVGRVTGCSEQAAWKRISRGKQELKKALGPDAVESVIERDAHA